MAISIYYLLLCAFPVKAENTQEFLEKMNLKKSILSLIKNLIIIFPSQLYLILSV